MGLFRKKDDEYYEDDLENEVQNDNFTEEDEDDYYSNKNVPSSELGQPSLINLISPSYWATDDLMEDEFVMRENMKSRTYGIAAYVPPSGYPRQVNSSILQEVLALGFVDITMDIVPQQRRDTMKSLTNMINVIRSNADWQAQHNQNFQMRENIAKYNDIDNFLDQVQFDENRMYDVSLNFIIYGTNDREVNHNFGLVADLLANNNVSLTPFSKRQKSGYLQSVPIGSRMINLDDTYRNVDRKALSALDLARNAAGKFNGGIPFGVNQATPSQNTEFLNIFGNDNHRPINYNMGIVGESGGGKSTSNKLKMAREIAILGYEHRSIDPDGEYVLLAKNLDQLNLTITTDAGFVINPCAISVTETALEEITIKDDAGRQLTDDEVAAEIMYSHDGRKLVTHDDGSRFVQKVNASQMIANLQGFMNVIFRSNGSNEGLTISEISCLEEAASEVIKDFGITNDPDSLFQNKAGTLNGQFYDRLPKPEPTLTDIYNKLIDLYTNDDGTENPKVTRLLDGLKPYLRTGSKPIFDGQTNFGNGRSATLNSYKYVNFDISKLDTTIQHVTYYVICQYLWERWMKNPAKALAKKVVDADEILQFIDDPFMSSQFETFARRCRKYNGSLTWLTQDIERLGSNIKAKALVTNSEFTFILQIKPEHRQLMKNALDLTDGALDILTGHPEPGEGIFKQEGDLVWIKTNPSREEMKFAESNRAVAKSKEQREIVDSINLGLKY